MQLQSLKIVNFKNIANAALEFSPGVNCFLGNNGMGKSNLLDAIHFLSFCRSFTGATDAQLIRRGDEFAMLTGRYRRRDADEELIVGLQQGRRKSFKRSGKEYRKLSDHIGLFPAVLIAPADTNLVTGTSEERRRFLDPVISQSDPRYLDALIRYQKALEQRNAMLRDGASDPGLYATVEMMMDMAAEYITATRASRIDVLREIFARHYARISGTDEMPDLTYIDASHRSEGSLAERLAANRQRDLILKYTTSGPHRDDIDLTIDSMPVRRIASQGQAKTYTIALRLAQYDFLRKATGVTPLLLLDDIFDKLDAGRVEHIMSLVTGDAFGQTFITDTNRRHFDEIVSRLGDNYRLWQVDRGEFTPLNSPEP